MADVTRRRNGELTRQLLELLRDHPQGLQAREALVMLERALTLTAYEQGTFDSGDRRFEKLVRFATVTLVKAGWLAKARGRWSVTEDGLQAVARFKDPETFYREALRLYSAWRNATIPESHTEEVGEPEVAEVSITYEQARSRPGARLSSISSR